MSMSKEQMAVLNIGGTHFVLPAQQAMDVMKLLCGSEVKINRKIDGEYCQLVTEPMDYEGRVSLEFISTMEVVSGRALGERWREQQAAEKAAK